MPVSQHKTGVPRVFGRAAKPEALRLTRPTRRERGLENFSARAGLAVLLALLASAGILACNDTGPAVSDAERAVSDVPSCLDDEDCVGPELVSPGTTDVLPENDGEVGAGGTEPGDAFLADVAGGADAITREFQLCVGFGETDMPLDELLDFDFGIAAAGDEVRIAFRFRVCGTDLPSDATITLMSVELDDPGDAFAFSVASGGQIPNDLRPEFPVTVVLSFSPSVAGAEFSTAATFRLSGGTRSEFRIRLRGASSPNLRPTAIAKCSIDLDDGALENDLRAFVFSTVRCSARESFDSDGTVVDWQWQILERPPSSLSEITRVGSGEVSIFLDEFGTYRLRLVVADESGLLSSSEGRAPTAEAAVTIEAFWATGLTVDLTWHTPADPDETDTGFGKGTDLDLHLLHPNGCWNDRVWDCHFAAQSPDWGDAGPPSGPSIDIDDTDGAGPERVLLDEPENGAIYKIGVNYHSDIPHFGATEARIRVLVYGELVFEASRTLPAEGSWWIPAAVAWPSGEIIEIDQLSSDEPACR